jgi:hypothetical protein
MCQCQYEILYLRCSTQAKLVSRISNIQRREAVAVRWKIFHKIYGLKLDGSGGKLAGLRIIEYEQASNERDAINARKNFRFQTP